MGHSNVWNSHPKNYGPGSRVSTVWSTSRSSEFSMIGGTSLNRSEEALRSSWIRGWDSGAIVWEHVFRSVGRIAEVDLDQGLGWLCPWGWSRSYTLALIGMFSIRAPRRLS
ncbi:hypothetical protein C4D60_Mb06t08790 [Musa balbisiana]|uniref:Uncharacterized protein n=1 Tax=Musa balbisiana TaxID=52838 RepID=A0A4S8ILK9_MUSBA|nr:hypothetical protein C4D60_Mb06t08790 [Musa balbisiana]